MYAVNVDLPTKTALVHAEACRWYESKKREGDGSWHGGFSSRDAALAFAKSMSGLKRVANARGCCERL